MIWLTWVSIVTSRQFCPGKLLGPCFASYQKGRLDIKGLSILLIIDHLTAPSRSSVSNWQFPFFIVWRPSDQTGLSCRFPHFQERDETADSPLRQGGQSTVVDPDEHMREKGTSIQSIGFLHCTNSKKAAMVEFLRRKGIDLPDPVPRAMTKKILLEKIKEGHYEPKYVVDELCHFHGIPVLRLPLFLQPDWIPVGESQTKDPEEESNPNQVSIGAIPHSRRHQLHHPQAMGEVRGSRHQGGEDVHHWHSHCDRSLSSQRPDRRRRRRVWFWGGWRRRGKWRVKRGENRSNQEKDGSISSCMLALLFLF